MLENFPIEFISNIVSFIIIGAIVVRFVKYKKKVAVIDGLYELKDKKQLTVSDKEYITSNLEEYRANMHKQEGFNKLMYPAFVLVAGIFLIFFQWQEAMIHLNILVVAYIYFYIKKVHYKNIYDLLKGLNN